MSKIRLTLLLTLTVLFTTAAAAHALSNVRFLHASPDSPTADVYVNGVGALFNLAYKKGSPFVGVDVTQPPTVTVTIASSSTPLFPAFSPTLTDAAYYTAIIANERAAVAPVLVQDDPTLPAAGFFRMRLGHFAAGAKIPVDVYVTAADANLATATASVANLQYAQVGAYLDLPVGVQRIRITPAGDKATVLYDSEGVTFKEGWVLTTSIQNFSTALDQTLTLVVLTNDPAKPTFELPAQRARVRLGNASAAVAVDQYLDGLFNINGLGPNRGTDYFNVAAGQRSWQLNAFNTQTVLQPATPVDFAKDSSVIAIALGLNAAPFETLFFAEDFTPPSSSINFKIRFAHAAINAQGAVDVYLTAPGADINAAQPTIANLAYKTASPYVELQGNNYQIRITPTGTKQIVFDTGAASGIGGGLILTTVIAQAVNPQAPLALLNFTSLDTFPFYIINSQPITQPNPTPAKRTRLPAILNLMDKDQN